MTLDPYPSSQAHHPIVDREPHDLGRWGRDLLCFVLGIVVASVVWYAADSGTTATCSGADMKMCLVGGTAAPAQTPPATVAPAHTATAIVVSSATATSSPPTPSRTPTPRATEAPNLPAAGSGGLLSQPEEER